MNVWNYVLFLIYSLIFPFQIPLMCIKDSQNNIHVPKL